MFFDVISPVSPGDEDEKIILNEDDIHSIKQTLMKIQVSSKLITYSNKLIISLIDLHF
jgi:hypothetical protein